MDREPLSIAEQLANPNHLTNVTKRLHKGGFKERHVAGCNPRAYNASAPGNFWNDAPFSTISKGLIKNAA